ncbi:SusD/RagB family nutrient-binding outer membrane lipoprotein [Confluentibacter sediminis]|uniref:SusD/RagB family nutrient-binding outer membrane lipoprotein n=1 Tax=Confluentibacter sediminis TaxID=2219045 RepID=UPI000DAE5714|nr:SusD/RagB family nutrient-binding outer membrane lipoprotein [Confluentibacter sediminis]
MKKIFYLAIFSIFMITTSCDKGFEDINIDPTAATQIDVKYKFPKAILYTAGQRYETWRGNFIYCSVMIQHLASTQGYWNGDKYTLSTSYAGAYWEAQYPQTIKSIEDIKAQLETDEKTDTPEYAMVRILRVFAYQRLTDLYGDIPYSEAGKAYISGILRPAYDSQEFIYNDMLNELNESAALLGSGTSELGTADILYNGDEAKWKKWAYSMMLRLSLRLVKVDPALAQQWATTAISGGVMTSNDDIAYVIHQQGNGIVQNANGEVFSADRSSRISKTFLDFLQGDPRMRVYAALPDGNDDPAVQKGLPNGYDSATLVGYSGGADMTTYSEVNSNFLQGEDAPMFFQTYAEVEFMLAEAAVRWGLAGGDAASHYNAGVTAAMKYLELYSPDAAISDTEISAYLLANPYDSANALEQINTQYWAAVFLDEYEAYANWRRTGFPVLTPVNYPGNVTNGTIPRRLTYYTADAVTNTENYNAAVSAQGPDLLTTRMWWDAE